VRWQKRTHFNRVVQDVMNCLKTCANSTSIAAIVTKSCISTDCSESGKEEATDRSLEFLPAFLGS
jgi:hypothetical protein